MKTLTIVLMFVSVTLFGQEEKAGRIPMLGEKAPAFTAESTSGKVNFPDDYFNKWKILFSHPAAFTPVCSSEMIELAHMQDEFKKLNTALLVISTDGNSSNTEWKYSLSQIDYKNKGKVEIKFPLVSDKTMEISKKYGMFHPAYNDLKNIRGVFIVDPQDRIRAIMFYPDETGRNLDEIKRTLLALQKTDKSSVLTPANWVPGEDVLLKGPDNEASSAKYQNSEKSPKYAYAWYMWFLKQ